MKTRVSLKYFVNDCHWKQYFVSNAPHTPSKLVSLTTLVTVAILHICNQKTKQLSCKKGLKFSTLGKYFSHLFTEVEIWS